MSRRLLAFLTLMGLFALSHAASAATLYVPTTAYPTIQSAINASVNGDTVLIADGTYTGPGDVDLDFAGKNITVTSLNGPSKTIINCGGTSSANHRGFYLHSGETNAIISGLTIENGYKSTNDGNGYAGGIDDSNVGLTISNCLLTNNTGFIYGGGIDNDINSGFAGTVEITNCFVTNNTVVSGNGRGGGICTNAFGGNVVITHCSITGNTATANGIGGGIYNFTSIGKITVANCVISGNTVTDIGTGGGIENDGAGNGYGLITITDCTVTGNKAVNGSGGGIFDFDDDANPNVVINCTVSGNTASTGNAGGIYNYNINGYFSSGVGGTSILFNNIVYGNIGGELGSYTAGGSVDATLYYCDVLGGIPGGSTDGGGNKDADPLFINSVIGDYHLLPTSLCLGAGTSSASGYLPYTEDFQPRPNLPSIGAFEMETARLVLTNITVSRSGGSVTVSASLHNYGSGEADAVQITRAKLGTVSATAPLPGSSVIAAGGVQAIKLTFTTSATGRKPLSIQGTTSGPSFSAGQFVLVP